MTETVIELIICYFTGKILSPPALSQTESIS